MRWLAVALGCLLSTTAWAGAVWLESPPTADKAEATSLQAKASGLGLEARVVRRYRASVGWEYVVVVEGFTETKPAREAAAKLASASGRAVSIFEAEGDGAKVLGSAEAEPAKPAMLDDAAGAAQAAALLQRAVAAHGAGAALVERADTVRFEFRRKVPDGPVAKHVFGRREADLYVQVDIERGTGVGSVLRLVADKATLQAGGTTSQEDLGEARVMAGRFAPETVVAFALEFGRAAGARHEFDDLRPAGERDVVGTRCAVLARTGDKALPPLELAVDPQSGLVMQVVNGKGASRVVHEFTDYKTLDGVVVPTRIRAWRGDKLIDEVEVLELDLGTRLPEAWFGAAPG